MYFLNYQYLLSIHILYTEYNCILIMSVIWVVYIAVFCSFLAVAFSLI